MLDDRDVVKLLTINGVSLYMSLLVNHRQSLFPPFFSAHFLPVSFNQLFTRERMRVSRALQIFKRASTHSRCCGEVMCARHDHTSISDTPERLRLHNGHSRAHLWVNTEHPRNIRPYSRPRDVPMRVYTLTLVITHTTPLPTYSQGLYFVSRNAVE